MAQGTQIHIAAWPYGVPERGRLLSRALAAQGCCYVIAVGAAWTEEAVPEGLIGLDRPGSSQDEPASCIIGPRGKVLAEVPTVDEETIITVEGSLEEVKKRKLIADIAGHYSRPDVLQLQVNRRPLANLVESGSEG